MRPPLLRSHYIRWVGRVLPVVLAAAVLLAIGSLAIVAPWISLQRLGEVDLNTLFAPPIWAGGTWRYPLGTDQLGRDMLTLLTVRRTRIPLGWAVSDRDRRQPRVAGGNDRGFLRRMVRHRRCSDQRSSAVAAADCGRPGVGPDLRQGILGSWLLCSRARAGFPDRRVMGRKCP